MFMKTKQNKTVTSTVKVYRESINLYLNIHTFLGRLSSTRTGTSRAAPMSAAVTALTCLPTSAAATHAEWRAAALWSMTVLTSWETNSL